MKLKLLDLFSGIGGFSLAGRWAGFETVQFVEKDKFCQKVLAKNFPGVPIHDDIKNFHYSDKVDLITGGFPCQGFSVAGKRKGFQDDRYLWPDMFRIIRECRPTWIIAENVSGIIPFLDPILEDLERENYFWQAYLIPASATGAPHKRERLWIVAHRNSERCDNGSGNRQTRHFQVNFNRHLEAIQSEWPQFIPESWKDFNAQNWLESTTDTDHEQRNEGAENKNAITERFKRQGFAAETLSYESIFNWEKDQPPISGMDDGLSKRLHGLERNRALGNSIVPQVVYPIMKIISLIEKVEE